MENLPAPARSSGTLGDNLEPWQSHILSIAIPMVPAAFVGYVLKCRDLVVGSLVCSVLGQILFTPFVMASFDAGATERDRIIAHAMFDLPYTLFSALVGGVCGYIFYLKYPPDASN